MQRQQATGPAQDVGVYMINIVLLSLLGVIDAVKKEIHIFIILPITLGCHTHRPKPDYKAGIWYG